MFWSKAMTRRGALIAASFLVGAALAACASRDTDVGASAAASRTFVEQYDAGHELFAAHCAKCHGDSGQGTSKAPRLVGLKQGALPVDPPLDRKVRRTRFVTVGDVADFVVYNMPPGKAGSLTPDEYWAILAFDLHANGIDLERKLAPDTARTLTIPR
jgi:cytochrome c